MRRSKKMQDLLDRFGKPLDEEIDVLAEELIWDLIGGASQVLGKFMSYPHVYNYTDDVEKEVVKRFVSSLSSLRWWHKKLKGRIIGRM